MFQQVLLKEHAVQTADQFGWAAENKGIDDAASGAEFPGYYKYEA